MVGRENELAYFYQGTSTPDGSGGFTTDYAEIAYNPVWVEVRNISNRSKGMDATQSITWEDNKTLRMRINNLWSPNKSTIVKIRDSWYGISESINEGFRDEYLLMTIHKIDH